MKSGAITKQKQTTKHERVQLNHSYNWCGDDH